MKRLVRQAALTPEQYIDGYPHEFQHIEKGEETVYVDDIIGMSYSRAGEYDDNFQPIGEPDERWEKVYEKAKLDNNVDFGNPITLVQVPGEDKYFIWDDGNHRLSVAKKLSIPTINAIIIELIPKSEDNEEQLESIMEEIRAINEELRQLNLKQQSLYDDEDLTMEQVNKKYDTIENEKQPLISKVDELWREHEEVRSKQ